MKFQNIAKLMIGILVCFTACTDDFEDLNTNPNAPASVQPELLLRQVIYGYGEAMAYDEFVAGHLLSQHLAMIDFNLFDRHALASPQEGGDPWPILYTALRDNETVLELSRTNPTQAVYEGPALVLKAYFAMRLTDLFGDVPYAEAFSARASGVTTPRYDQQEDIYLGDGGILDNLERAVAAMDDYAGSQALDGDVLYGGNLDNWVRLANSLRLKALLRISGRVDRGGAIQEIYDGGRFIEEADQDAQFPFSAGQPNNYPLATARIGIFNVFLMSATATENYATDTFGQLLREQLYRPANDGDYAGVANGIDAASAITPDEFARPGTIWREDAARQRFAFHTAWETEFLLAEAQLRGYLARDENLISNKFLRYWGVTDLDCDDDCLTLSGDPTAQLERLLTHKWTALAGRGYEAWIEWRRTGYPRNIRPAAASLNGGLIPVRMPYPAEEQALNFDNYSAAAARSNDNSINAPVWWDVE